jgi:hypothetical protein
MWRQFLEMYSRELLADRQVRSQVPDEVIRSGWMGFEPATRDEVADLEDRIGAQLPLSYKEFLATSNGWRQSGGFIYDVWPTSKVDWFRANNQNWIDAYVEPAIGRPQITLEEQCDYGEKQDPCKFRDQDLQSALLVSDVGDSAVYLLNPNITTPSGEWEAWFFANWYPGAARYRSFWDICRPNANQSCNCGFAKRDDFFLKTASSRFLRSFQGSFRNFPKRHFHIAQGNTCERAGARRATRILMASSQR